MTPDPVSPEPTSSTSRGPAKKTIPTPTRRQAEQARRDRIQPNLTRKQARERDREARFKSRDEVTAKINAHPPNALLRDWVDGRWNIAEFVLPGVLLIFVATIVGGFYWHPLAEMSTYIIWAVFILLIVDMAVMWIGLRNRLRIHFPDEPMKGKLSLSISRAMSMRRSRMPPPRVKRGTKFTWPYEQDH